MKKIEIYTTNYCSFCVNAKALLTRKNISFEEIDLTGNDEARAELLKRVNGVRTVPQIFIDDKHIGGCDDLYQLDGTGELDRILHD